MAARRKLPKPPPDTKPIGECTVGQIAAHLMTRDKILAIVGIIETKGNERYYHKPIAWIDEEAYWSHLRLIEDAISDAIDAIYQREEGKLPTPRPEPDEDELP